MGMVTCEDTEYARPERFMSSQEAVLHEQYSRLAAAKQALEELHDNGNLDTAHYYVASKELSSCMGIVDGIISSWQLAAELLWPQPCSESDFNGALTQQLREHEIEITRLVLRKA